MGRIKLFLFVNLILILVTFACSPQLAQNEPTTVPTATLTASPTQTELTLTPSAIDIPLTEAEVPRVPVDQAKVAFDSGQAIIVDVRSPDAYAASHVAGAINISLGEIETNPTGLKLDKNQWIITYCT